MVYIFAAPILEYHCMTVHSAQQLLFFCFLPCRISMGVSVGVQIVRHAKATANEEMINRMRARIEFLQDETGKSDIVFLDTDMLVTKSMKAVFEVWPIHMGRASSAIM
jgi:hypothetical protein